MKCRQPSKQKACRASECRELRTRAAAIVKGVDVMCAARCDARHTLARRTRRQASTTSAVSTRGDVAPPPPPLAGGALAAAAIVLLAKLFALCESGWSLATEAETVTGTDAGTKVSEIAAALTPERTTSKAQLAVVAPTVHAPPPIDTAVAPAGNCTVTRTLVASNVPRLLIRKT